jgi:hypothetical protein
VNISYNRQGDPTKVLQSLAGYVGHLLSDDFLGEVCFKGASGDMLHFQEWTPGDAGRGTYRSVPIGSITSIVVY